MGKGVSTKSVVTMQKIFWIIESFWIIPIDMVLRKNCAQENHLCPVGGALATPNALFGGIWRY